MNGFIKLFRQLTRWEWYGDVNVRITFIHLLLTANFKAKNWRGITIERGQLLTSLDHLSTDIGLTVAQLRTALKKLKSTGEITTKTTNKYTIITICKYDSYQDKETPDNKQDNKQYNKPPTNKSQTNNNQIATTEECKELKEYKECKEEESKSAHTQESENLDLKNQKSEAQKKEKSCAKKEKSLDEILSESSNGFPSMEEFDSTPASAPTMRSWNLGIAPKKIAAWSEALKKTFLDYCRHSDEKSNFKLTSTTVSMYVDEVNEILVKHDDQTAVKCIKMTIKKNWSEINVNWMLNDEKRRLDKNSKSSHNVLKENNLIKFDAEKDRLMRERSRRKRNGHG